MEDLLASVGTGTRLRIDDVDYTCLSRFALDRRDDMIVLHDTLFPLDHPYSLETMLGSTLIELHRLGRVHLEVDGDGSPPSSAIPLSARYRREYRMAPAT